MLQQRRDLLVRLHRGLAQVPGAPLGPVGERVGERRVRGAPLAAQRLGHHGGADQRVPEPQPLPALLDLHQPLALDRREVLQAGPAPGAAGRRLQHAQVTGPFEGRQQEQPPGGGGQTGDP
ncbi:hypothetical protein [Kitasatospora sp. NPDC057595]|uniref:hypothetical protein n=1 Tax=Kitasatospora sp. NPDC057595 TaxID=3346177 RepID=UPI0036C70913